MKRKFEYLMKYLKALNCGDTSFYVEVDEEHIEYLQFNCQGKNVDTLPDNFENILNEIINIYEEEIYDAGPGSSDRHTSNYYSFNIKIDTTNESLYFDDVNFIEYGTEDSGMAYHFEDTEEGESTYDYFIEIREFMEMAKVSEITVTYQGGGDSGYVEGTCETDKGKVQTPEFLEKICYNLLEEYGGWEINEGSQGNIEFTFDTIEVNHEWNTEEEYSNDIGITVTKDSFND